MNEAMLETSAIGMGTCNRFLGLKIKQLPIPEIPEDRAKGRSLRARIKQAQNTL